jgi:methyltransferase (TIGR00027 family)
MSGGDRGAPSVHVEAPESTAERVALWRAMHLLVDEAPQVIEDGIGLQLLDPDPQWRSRPDMDPAGTRGFRASIVSRARFIEDLVAEQAERGTRQYVLLGAGLDTFAQRRPELASRLRVFEVDQPGAQAWKRRRLVELGYGIPEWLRLVPVDFETDGDWWQRLVEAGFDPGAPALVASTGVTMYLSEEATTATLRRLATLAPGSMLAMTFLLPPDLLVAPDRAGLQSSKQGAQASGTPFISFYRPERMLAMAREAGFADARHVAGSELADRYFTDRADGLRPQTGEDFLIATT